MTDTYRVAMAPPVLSKLPAGDPRWREFNGSFVNMELDQVGIAARLYEGSPITTWLSPQWRKTENYQCGQHIGLDFDTGDARSAMTTLLKDRFIHKHAAILYTTPSHTPDAPRCRVIFLLDTPIRQAKNYVLAATALLWLFGAADRQCKDPVRFFYGGKPGACEMEWPANVLPLDMVKDLIQRYQTTGLAERRRHVSHHQPGTTEEREIMDALRVIDPWGIAYDQWLAVLMAIHSEMPNDTGLSIAEAWAQGKQDEVARKWKGFDQDGGALGRVTLGTLFAIAKEHGWRNG